jgi:hypothetical protein
MSCQAERRPEPGENEVVLTRHEGVQSDSILIDQVQVWSALRQGRASNFEFPSAHWMKNVPVRQPLQPAIYGVPQTAHL